MTRFHDLALIVRDPTVSNEEKAEAIIACSYKIKVPETNGYRLIRAKRGTHARMVSHLIWNLYNPDDRVQKGEIVHHKNENSLDDWIGNYEKMTKGAHTALHCTGGTWNRGRTHTFDTRVNMSLAHVGNSHSEETKAKMRDSQQERRDSQIKWDPSEVLRLRESGLSQREVARRVGCLQGNVHAYFKRRGMRF